MTRLELEADTVRALSDATTALMVAACELGEAGRFAAALEANAAAKAANIQTQAVCDAVLSRPWVRLFNWIFRGK